MRGLKFEVFLVILITILLISMSLFWSEDTYGLLPRRHKITSVVGRPIRVTKFEKPTTEDIENLQKLYIDELMW